MKTKLRIRNFRCLDDVEIELKPAIFFLGPNGSGKSTTLKAIGALFQDIFPKSPEVKTLSKNINDLEYLNYNDNFEKIEFFLNYDFEDSDWDKLIFEHSNIDYTFDLYIKKCTENDADEYELSSSDTQTDRKIYWTEKIEDFNPDNLCEPYTIEIDYGSCIPNIRIPSLGLLSQLAEVKKAWNILREKEEKKFQDIAREVASEETIKNEIAELNYGDLKKFDLLIKVGLKLKEEKIIPTFSIISNKLGNEIIFFGDAVLVKKIGGVKFPRERNIRKQKSGENFQLLEFGEIYLFTILNKYKENLDVYHVIQEINHHYLFIKLAFDLITNIDLMHSRTVREIPQSYYDLSEKRNQSRYRDILLRLNDKEYYKKLLNSSEDKINSFSFDDNYLNILWSFKKLGFCDLFYRKQIEKLYSIEFIKNDQKFNLTEASSGFQQLFTVVYDFFESGGITLIEQPELHINPKLQSKIVEIMLDRNRYNYFSNHFNKDTEPSIFPYEKGSGETHAYYNKCLIIETHSEHIIRKLQVLIALGMEHIDNIEVYFFKEESNGKIKIKKLPIDTNGNFLEEWPDGFFDSAADLTFDLLIAQLKKAREN